MLVLSAGLGDHTILGSTLDDSIGEAFDKTARLLGITKVLRRRLTLSGVCHHPDTTHHLSTAHPDTTHHLSSAHPDATYHLSSAHPDTTNQPGTGWPSS